MRAALSACPNASSIFKKNILSDIDSTRHRNICLVMVAPMVVLETAKIHSRETKYERGDYSGVMSRIPEFELRDFKASGCRTANPYLRSVHRLPDENYAEEIPVGVVSRTYGLVSHREVLRECYSGIKAAGISTENMKIDLGLSKLGEWMNLRFYMPDEYDIVPGDRHPLKLRLEAFNSVDGSSRFKLMLSWLRLICSNGMTIRETIAEFTDVHDSNIDLSPIPEVILSGMKKVPLDVRRLKRLEGQRLKPQQLEHWVDGHLSNKWGVKLAARIYRICTEGRDAKFADPFAKGKATEKPMELLEVVPGSPAPAENLYAVAQAMSWASGTVKDLLRREKLLLSIEDQLKALSKLN